MFHSLRSDRVIRIVAFPVDFLPAEQQMLLGGWMQETAEMQAIDRRFIQFFLSGQNRTAVHVEDFPVNKAGMLGTEEQYGGGDFLRLTDAAQGNSAANLLSALWICKRSRAHISVNPARSNAIYVDACRSELGCESLGHADQRALARGIVAVKCFSSLAARGTDQHDMSSRSVGARLRLHLRHGVFDQAEHSVEIDGHGGAPLLVRHALDRNVFRRPDSMVGDENVESTKMFDRLGHECAGSLWIFQVRGDGMADGCAALLGHGLCLGTGAAITERYLGACGSEHSNRSSADAARTTRDQSNFA